MTNERKNGFGSSTVQSTDVQTTDAQTTDAQTTDTQTTDTQATDTNHSPSANGHAAPANELSLTAALESLLFVAEQPVSPTYLARVLQTDEETIEQGLHELDEFYQANGRGVRLQKRADTYLLVSAPAAASLIESFLNLDLSYRLSGPALEALAIVAYRQPVTRAQVEAVRGVDCGGVLRTLQQVGLVEEVGRLESVGRPILYGVTEEFMHHFGLTNMQELPDLEETDADALWAATELIEDAEQAETEPEAEIKAENDGGSDRLEDVQE